MGPNLRIHHNYHQSWAFKSCLYHCYAHTQEPLVPVILQVASNIMNLQKFFFSKCILVARLNENKVCYIVFFLQSQYLNVQQHIFLV